ncbi:MAG: peptide deformylase [Campylobacteraceae bacterium]|jgi:peptide deformylase|nr:peptide deformylase [Campylobacteraceae bacterium]
MIREVITYPNPKLRTVSKDVVAFNDELHTLLDDMYDTMIAKNGIGLAAIQVAVPLNVLIINLSREDESKEVVQVKEDLIEFINPTIIEQEGVCTFQEGCLSVPNFYEDVERAKIIKIRYFDRAGNEHIATYDGLMSIALQHEIDHLQGRLFIEKLSYLKRKKFEKEWKKIVKEEKAKK